MATLGSISKSIFSCSFQHSYKLFSSIQCRNISRQLSKRYIQTTPSTHFPSFDKEFEKAKERLNSLKEDPGNEAKLKLYALFKQATQGQCNVPKPGLMDFVGGVKWKAWKDLGSMSQDDAQKAYISLVNELAASEPAPVQADPASGIQYEGMKITRGEGVLMLQLNRPNKKNAITWQMYRDIGKTLQEAATDDRYRIAVITGSGDYYCSGNDLSNFTNVTMEKIPQMAKEGRYVLLDFVNAFIEFPKPLIALVNGPAVGISVTTLGLCDVVFATDRATFHTPFSSLGQSPEACSSYTFPKLMGYTKANEMLLFNKKISAIEACDRNLVSEVFPDAAFGAETAARVQQFAKCPPQSLKLTKILNRQCELQTLKNVNELECQLLEERWQSTECINAVKAFFTRK